MAHSILSPSASHRWMACPPSARLERLFPDVRSEAAEEGTLAHHMAEISLKRITGEIDKETASNLLHHAQKHKNYSVDMAGYVNTYVSAVSEVIDMHSKVYIESRVDLSDYAPACAGTVDAAVVNGDTLYVFDLKYGKGVAVEAEENPQLMMYALGLLREIDSDDISTVVCNIVQPRLNSHSTYIITTSQLLSWGKRTLRHAAIEAYTGGGEFSTGEHCKFCKAKGVCRKLSNECSGIDDKEVAILSAEEVSERLRKVPQIEAWCKALQEHALRSALDGKAIPHYKIVEGRSIRKYSDEAALLQALTDNGIDKGLVTKTSLISLGELEKLLGKKTVSEEYGAYIARPAGKPTLVPEEDKREAIDAASDFVNIKL